MTRPPSIGDLRERVTLQQRIYASDGGGGVTESWSAIIALWAAVRTLGGEERLAADAISGRLTHEVWLHYRAGVTPAMRFEWRGRPLEIRAVFDPDGRQRRLKCLCAERDL